MTCYFTTANSKSTLRSNEVFNGEGSRPDLLLKQYELTRARMLTDDATLIEINDMYMKWCDLLFSGFNVAVLGGQSKFSLLETFKKKYLDSERLPDFRQATGFNGTKERIRTPLPTSEQSSRESTPVVASKAPTRRGTRSRRAPTNATKGAPEPNIEIKPSELRPIHFNLSPENCPMLSITTVRLHGLDPIKSEAFNHALFDITESRRSKDSDYSDFIKRIKRDNIHYVFLIHSFGLLLRDCDDVCESIFRLYEMDPIHVHILLSSDELNIGKKLHNLKIRLRLSLFLAPFSESFLWEKTDLMNEFDERDANETAAHETTVHRLFNDKTDLQSLKDIHQALDGATAAILMYIFKDYVEKCEANQVADDDDQDFVPCALVRDDDQDAADQNRMQPKRQAKARQLTASTRKGPRPSKRPKKLETHLDFHHLLNHCESQFIIRRGAALRDHLGELKDHHIIADDEAGNKIQCLIEARMCKKFLDWVEQQNQ